MTPIFLLSLPRSGSTLLQRMLAVHPAVATAAEPWIMLPLASMTSPQPFAVAAPYQHDLARAAIDDFASRIPGGISAVDRACGEAARSLYAAAAKPGQSHFLDKTPRYYMIPEFLASAFPDAKFILLFRNPVEVAASMLETWWTQGSRMKDHKTDLLDGPGLMVHAAEKLGKRACIVHYQDLVRAPQEEFDRLLEFLELPRPEADAGTFNEVQLDGRMGDPTGVKRYSEVSTEPLAKWMRTLQGTGRRNAARKYLDFLPDDVLGAFRTNRGDVLRALGVEEVPRPSSVRHPGTTGTRPAAEAALLRLQLAAAQEELRKAKEQLDKGPFRLRQLLRHPRRFLAESLP